MKLYELKEWVNSLPEDTLHKQILYVGEYQSGVVQDITLSDEDLYYDGQDDPSELYNKSELLNFGIDEDEISTYTKEIEIGDPIIII